MLLEGKKIIVTGGVTGTGKAAVETFVKEGATVVSMSRKAPTDERVVKIMEDINSAGPGKAMHIQCDVTDQDMVNKAFDEAVEKMGGLDGLCTFAGIEYVCPAEDLTKESLYSMLDVHLLGTVFTNIAACKHMKEKGGSIVNSGSVCGVTGLPYYGAYGPAKAGIITFSRIAAMEWGQYNIRVNSVAISSESDMAAARFDRSSKEELEALEAAMKEKVFLAGKGRYRMGTPHQCANSYLFLMSDLSDYTTGQLLFADGGYVMVR